MADKPRNPILFNPDGHTVRQLKDMADTLRAVFDGIDRGVDPENIVHNLRQAREQYLQSWWR